MVVLYFLWWFLFDMYTENSVLAVGIVYIIERLLRELRRSLGKRNLVAKAFLDERFLN